MEKECPCIDCICVPICKHRDYPNLVSKCAIIQDYLYMQSPSGLGRTETDDFDERTEIIARIMDGPKYPLLDKWRGYVQLRSFKDVQD